MDNFASSTVVPNAQEGPIFHSEDLARMRHAYEKACHEAMMPEASEAQRTGLAKSIISTYRSGLSEDDLIVAATNLVK
jgi:hypothetical protein